MRIKYIRNLIELFLENFQSILVSLSLLSESQNEKMCAQFGIFSVFYFISLSPAFNSHLITNAAKAWEIPSAIPSAV